MFRQAETFLSQWFASKRRKPLVLRGARQVGKTELVRQFAANNNLILAEINLERYLYLDKIFQTLSPQNIIREIESITECTLDISNTLLFLDEIQATPFALQALRYFYEERPDLPVIAAGSLLEFTLKDHNFSMPVGRIEYFHLGPTTFKEFLQAIDEYLIKYINEYKIGGSIPESAHKKLLERQREYLFIGGMPEAVLQFKETNSLREVSAVHRSITNTYLDDFSKYAKQKELVLLQRVFNTLPKMIGKKVKYSNFSKEDRSKDVKYAIDLLRKNPKMSSTC